MFGKNKIGSRDNSRLNNLKNVPPSKNKPPKPPCNQYIGESNDAEYYANKLLSMDMLDCRMETLIGIYTSSAAVISEIDGLVNKHGKQNFKDKIIKK